MNIATGNAPQDVCTIDYTHEIEQWYFSFRSCPQYPHVCCSLCAVVSNDWRAPLEPRIIWPYHSFAHRQAARRRGAVLNKHYTCTGNAQPTFAYSESSASGSLSVSYELHDDTMVETVHSCGSTIPNLPLRFTMVCDVLRLLNMVLIKYDKGTCMLFVQYSSTITRR